MLEWPCNFRPLEVHCYDTTGSGAAGACPAFVCDLEARKGERDQAPAAVRGRELCLLRLGIIAQLTTIKARLAAGDVGGIEDTIDAAIIIAVVLTAVTVIADVIALSLTGEEG